MTTKYYTNPQKQAEYFEGLYKEVSKQLREAKDEIQKLKAELREIESEVLTEIDFTEQDITANMDSYMGFDLARDAVKEYFENR